LEFYIKMRKREKRERERERERISEKITTKTGGKI
jgi:hypothetical protein